jgi:hypothetical protein
MEIFQNMDVAAKALRKANNDMDLSKVKNFEPGNQML